MMKKSILILILVGLLSACSSPKTGTPTPTQPSQPVLPKNTESVSNAATDPAPETQDTLTWAGAEMYQAGLTPDYQAVLQDLDSYNQVQLDLEITEDFSTFSGRMNLYFFNQDEALENLYFHLYPNYQGAKFEIYQVLVDGFPADWSLEASDTILAVSLPEVLNPQESLVVSMNFTSTIPQVMGGNYGLFGYFDGVLVLDTFYPTLAVYDQRGWQANYPDPVGDLTYADASFYEVRVKAPSDLVFASSGITISETEQDGWQEVVFAAGPARDFYLAGSRAYQRWSTQWGDVTVNSYAFGELQDGAQLALKSAEQALTVFSERYGAYPYTEFDVISSPMQALGIEYPGITGISLDLYRLDESPTNAIYLESVVAHEVGHQWFYNMVGNDQQDEPWLDEALAQFVTGVYYEDIYGLPAATQYRLDWDTRWKRVDREAIPIGRPAETYEGRSYSAIIYGRGPYFIMQLKQAMGEEAFDQFMKTYVQEFAWKNSTTQDFRALAEETCACDLSDLFAEWVYEP